MLEIMKDQEFDQVYSLMQKSFPIDEYRPVQEQQKLLQNQNYRIYTVHDTDKTTVRAFLAVWQFFDFTYFEHFAVDTALRGQGMGSMILKEASRLFDRQICLEAELPDTEIAKRRIEFYRRNGYFSNDYFYMQPPISEGRKAVPLMIMTAKSTVTKEQFEKIKAVLYREVYHQTDAG